MNDLTTELKDLNLSEALIATEEEESEFDKIMRLMLDNNHLQHHTELTAQEITAFSVLSSMAKKYNLEILQEFLVENLKLRVSKGRAGRREWVKILGEYRRRRNEEEGFDEDRRFRHYRR